MSLKINVIMFFYWGDFAKFTLDFKYFLLYLYVL